MERVAVALAEPCRAELIAVGTEIVIGQIHNGHAREISQELAKHGMYVYYHSAVGDNEARIIETFSIASRRSNAVIATGGLGPTQDDLTKEALAKFLGRRLVLSQEALAEVESYFQRRGRPMPEQNRKQALVIEGGEWIPNPNGTAPGQYVFDNGVHYFLLPGPPLEMRPMLQNYVIPRLVDHFGGTRKLVSRILHFCGIGESDVDARIADLTCKDNPTVAPYAGEGEMVLRITASGPTEEACWELIRPVEEELRRRFAPFIYGVDDDSLASVVLRRLRETGSTLAVAESCTGGMLAEMITDVPGSSAAFVGGVVAYDNRVKASVVGVHAETLAAHGAVSEPTARELAEGVREKLGATYGIGVTGIAGPGGGTPEKPVGLVYVGLAGPRGSRVYELRLRGSRAQIRIRSCKQALWRLWQELNGDSDVGRDKTGRGEKG